MRGSVGAAEGQTSGLICAYRCASAGWAWIHRMEDRALHLLKIGPSSEAERAQMSALGCK
jgi:hypothetical protein